MKDYLIFYTFNNNQIYILAGENDTGHNIYHLIDYDYDNPMDDSPIVNTFNKELGNLIIDPETLLHIIKDPKFPHFQKYNDNGSIYLINIDYIPNDTLNELLNAYRFNYVRMGFGRLRWQNFKWFGQQDFEGNINQRISKHMLGLINKYQVIPLLKNYYLSNSNKYSENDIKLFEKIFQKKKIKLAIQAGLEHQWTLFQNAQIAYFKTIPYKQILVIYEYTTHTAIPINNYLRELLRFGEISYKFLNYQMSKIMLDYINQALTMYQIIENAPKYASFGKNSISLYRGLSFDPQLEVGNVTKIFQYNFNSTSTDKDMVANMFVPEGGAIFKLVVPPETPMLTVSGISHYSYEDEVLLLPGHTFQIISKQSLYNQQTETNYTFYKAILKNSVSYYQKISHAEENISFKLSQTKKSKNKSTKLIMKEKISNSKNFVPNKFIVEIIQSNPKQIKNMSTTIKKLIDLIRSKNNQCQNDQINDPQTNICYDLQSSKGLNIVSEQLNDIIDKRSIYQDSFDYDSEILLFKHLPEKISIYDIISDYIQKFMNRNSEQFNDSGSDSRN